VNAVERKGRGFKRRLCCGPARADKAAALSFKGNESPVDFVFPHQLFAEVNDFILDEFPAQLFFFRTQEPHNRLIPFPAPGAAQFIIPSPVNGLMCGLFQFDAIAVYVFKAATGFAQIFSNLAY
jgi:hypothetical protein